VQKASIYLFMGENAYLLREERKRWLAEFERKHGSMSLVKLDGQHITIRSLLDEVAVAPFLSERRLVIVDKVPKCTKEEVQKLSASIHPACILAFFDSKPDRRIAGVKELIATAEVQECALPSPKGLRQWLIQYAQSRSVKMTQNQVEQLIGRSGEDQDMLAQEMEKLCIAASGRELTDRDIQDLSVPAGERIIWELMRLISIGDTKGALTFARELLHSGESAFSVWNMLLWMLRSLTEVASEMQAGERSPAAIASNTKVPFPTVRTVMPIAGDLSAERLHRLVDWTVDADLQLKTGGYRATDQFPQELHALIDRFILECSSLAKK
jgi:DNA polymerase-3 subunit delta